MIQDFTKEEQESLRDTEFTLGGGMIFILGGGLLILCTLCFGLGYAIGHRAPAEQAESNLLPVPANGSAIVPAGSGIKPAAAGQAPVVPQTGQASDVPTDASSDTTEPAQLVPAVARAETSTSSLRDKSALANTSGWMVQIAAISHAEDADVLVNALRRRGYAVTARRDNADNLIHVQTGPFVSRNDANAMRQRLLSDGYNASVQ